ncbi:MAG: adenylate/guanylate cyclase domain-containing protein [Gaiellaceae bacterium]
MLICAGCGQENPDGFRFCGACGADLAAAPSREVRKTVTVVFSDVTGSTALGERLDPESLRNVMSRYFDEMQAALERHGGTVEKFIGDAVMAVFGIPALHEDDALRALRAAAEMRERLAIVNEVLQRDLGVTVEARIGVNTGEVVTGDAGARERLVTGDAVNVAARLEQAAQPGEILLGEETYRLARAAIEVEPAGALELKGKAQPLAAYRLVRVVEGAAAFERTLDAPLVGRREELARVRAAFDGALAERRCRLVTVFGPPGIGKSRLARELPATLGGRAAVLSGQCLSYGEGITYWPLREIFAAAGAADELDAALASGTSEDVFWAVRKALEARARERPLAVVVEDIHWAEPTLLDLLEHLVDWTRDAALLLLCLARPDLLDERPAWAAGRPNAETLALEPLAEGEADELIANVVDGSNLDAEARARVRSAAEGNPLFVEQLLASLAEGGNPDRVPSSIRALLAARIDALAEAERELLERAAVAGMEFEWAALARLHPDAGRPSGAVLATLVRKELIRPHEDLEDWFRFRHALIRDAAYERIPKELRAELHERAAGWLETKEADLDALIGYHLEQAVRLRGELGVSDARTNALAEAAGTRLGAAGRRAHARFDLPAARNLIERALALLPNGAARAELLFRLADTVAMSGEVARANELWREAAAVGTEAGEPALAARARLELAWLEDARPEELRRLADESLAAAHEAGDEEALLHGSIALGAVHWTRGQLGLAVEVYEEALELARRLAEGKVETDLVAAVFGSLVRGPLPVREALARAERDLAGAPTPSVQAPGQTFTAMLCALDGRIDEARQRLQRGQETALNIGADWPRAWSRGTIGATIELLDGRPDRAEHEIRAALETHASMGEERTRGVFTALLVEALVAQGRDDEAIALAADMPERPTGELDEFGSRLAARALAAVRAGAFEEAEQLAREAVVEFASTDLLWQRADTHMVLAEVLRSAGRKVEAREAAGAALALYEQKGHVLGAERARRALAA